MNRRFWRHFSPPFLVICASGAFIFFASGVQWGTPQCGALSAIILAIAVFVGLASTAG